MCDSFHSNRLAAEILAAVATDEAHQISERTKAALAAYKAQGGVLARDKPDDGTKARGRVMGTAAVKSKALTFAADLGPVVRELRAARLDRSRTP